MIEQIVDIDRMDHALALFGSIDENIRLLEAEYGVEIVCRGTQIKISGEPERVSAAYRAVQGLLSVLNRGENLTEQTVRYVIDMVAEGKAMLKQYEDGLKELEAGKAELAAGEQQLAEAEKQLAQGEKDLAAGKKALEAGEGELAAGAKELADGAAQLETGRNDLEAFESGMALVDEYTMVCFKNEPIYRHNGDMAVPGPEQRLGSDFDWKKYDENGNLMTLRTGEPYLDLDQCLVVCKSFRESVDHHVADVTHELYMRLGLYVALAVAAVLGIIGGILGLVGKKGAFVLGIITAVLAVGCNIFGLLTRYHGYTYPLKDGTYSGTLQIIAIITFALVALGFLIVTAAAKNEAAKQAAEA